MSGNPMLTLYRAEFGRKGKPDISEWRGTVYRLQGINDYDVPFTIALFPTEVAAREYAAWKQLDRIVITETKTTQTDEVRTVYRSPELLEAQS